MQIYVSFFLFLYKILLQEVQKKKSNKNNSTKTNSKSTGCSNSRKNGKTCKKSNSQESNADPDGSYTGNPLDAGKFSKPVQDVDDL